MNNTFTKKQVLFDFTHTNKGLLTTALLAQLVSNFLSILLPLSIGWYYEIVLHDHGTKSKILNLFPFQLDNTHQFYITFALLVLLKAVFVFLEKYYSGIAGERFSQRLRELAFEHQLQHSMSSHRLRAVGKYLLRYSGDLLAIQNLLVKGMLGFAGDTFFLVVAFATLFFINPLLTTVLIAVLLCASVCLYLLSKLVRTAAWNRRSQRSVNLGFVSSRMQAFYTIKSFNRETPENNAFVKRSHKLYELGVRFMKVSALVQALLPLFFFGTLLILFYAIAHLRTQTAYHISKSDVFVFILLLLYMQGVIKRVLIINLVWQVGLISFDKLLVLIQQPAESRDAKQTLGNILGRLRFEHVDFTYPNGKSVLKNLSFDIQPNTITLIKGEQGVGKSTLFKLIQKIYTPQGGTILLDEIAYDDLAAFDIRKEVTIVSPEVPLLGGTVFKAISYSTSEEKRDKAIAMLAKLNIRFVEDAERNLDYKLEDNAHNVSEGTRCLLQFARAFLTRKKILLLDNPFVHLDEASIQLVINQLHKLKSKRSILIIADKLPDNLHIDQTIQL